MENIHISTVHIVTLPLFESTTQASYIGSSCGENLETCLCDEGHTISIINPYDTLRLFPTGETLDYISRIITDDLLLPFGSSFFIARNYVGLYPLRDVASISITDIPELRIVHDIELSESEYNVLYSSLTRIKEKCRTTKRTCNKVYFGKIARVPDEDIYNVSTLQTKSPQRQ